MILYAFPVSIFSQKAMMACEEKSISYTLKEVNPLEPEPGAEYLKLTPWGRVPILVADNGDLVLESAIIAEYLDQSFPIGTRLLPEDPKDCLHVRYLDRAVELYFLAALRRIFYASRNPADRGTQAMLARAHEQLDECYAWLNDQLRGREWIAGSEFSLADCSLAVALNRASRVYPFDRHEPISAYANRAFARPSLARVRAVADRYQRQHAIELKVTEEVA